jgi:hypothetical protein
VFENCWAFEFCVPQCCVLVVTCIGVFSIKNMLLVAAQ